MNRAILHAAILAGLTFPGWAQAPPQFAYPPNYQPQPSYQPQQPPGQSSDPRMSEQELSNLAAPVALYPDMLLSEVLAASTYPLELAQAQQWMQGNPGLRGPALVEAAKQQNWDPSIQALVAFPDVMNMLTRDIQWTTDLGNAFLSQQADLMDAIQRLRASARANGRLTDTPQQRVTYQQQNGQNAIVIQPTDPQVVYPPVYNPEYVWGPPVVGAYPPLGYPNGYGIYYGVATFLGALFTGMLSFGGWGWGLSWLTHGLFLNGLFFSHFGFHGYSGYGFHGGYGGAARAAWVHDPGHRLGVPYGNRYAGARFGESSPRGFANFAGRSYSAGRTDYGDSGYRDSDYKGSRQMEAYRGLSASAARGYSAPNYGTSRSYAGVASERSFRGGYERGNSPDRGWSGASAARSYSAPNYGTSRNYAGVATERSSRGGYERGSSADRGFSGGHVSSAHYSAPKLSGHIGGGGHSGGHSHSGGGGHSHGGSHKK